MPKPKLIPVKPSGGKDESMVSLIHELVRQIPKGRVTTYGAIAKVLNIPNPRMVGKAMRSTDEKFPAQRVVNSAGKLSGDMSGHRAKLLEKEGVTMKGDKIVDFKTVFWDPAVDLI